MNQDTPPPLPPSLEFKDRKAGLTIFGILTVMIGLLCALFVPLMVAGQSMSQNAANAPQNHRGIFMVVTMYGGLAVTLIWLGIGSIMARRWARALLLIFAWGSLIMGVFMLIGMAVMAPQFMAGMAAHPAGQPALPEAAKWGILIAIGGILSVIFLIIPGIWVYFYGSKHVKATCEARDPMVRWTDRCPLPVLAASLLAAFASLSTVLTVSTMHGVFPFFGVFLVGLPGILVYLVMAILWAYAAWTMYKLNLRGWWVAFVILCFMPISGAITYAHRDIMDLYRLSGYSAQEIERLQQVGFLKSQMMAWITLLSALPWLGYLLYVRKFFRREAE